MKTIVLFLSLILIISGCAPTYLSQKNYSPVEKLSYQIEKQIDEPELETALLGIMVQSVETGEIFYQHNAKKLMMPASNEKIPTSVAALIKLGPDFRYETKLYGAGSIAEGVLIGDLIIVGSGDPTIGYRFCEQVDTCRVFKLWIDALKQKGISQIDGNIIGVDDIFDDEPNGYGWTFDNMTYNYAAQIGGLIFNENYATITIKVDSVTNELTVAVFPDFEYVNVIPDIKIVTKKDTETDLSFQRKAGTNDVTVRGTLKKSDMFQEEISIHNPTTYFLTGFAKELSTAGIKLNGEIIDSDELADSLLINEDQLIYTHFSGPFSEIIRILLKESQNLYAESFVKLLGYHFGKQGCFAEGERIIKSTLRTLGLENDAYQYRDGSGLSRYNIISPYQIVKILRRMYFHSYAKVFQNSLPIAGVDGTIGYRMKGTIAEGKVIAKTGTISNVRCLSGYVRTRDDEVLAFSIMANNFLCDVNVIMDLQDRICMLLSSFSRH